MKILHISFIGRGDAPTGLQEAVISLSNNQRKFGNEVKVVSLSQCSKIDNVNIIYCRSSNEFRVFMLKFQPDIAVFHSLYEWEQLSYSRILRKYNIPYILVFHGGASRDNAKKGWLKKKIANTLFFNNFIKHASRVVYLNQNEFLKSVFKKINNKYAIIPNGVNLPINPKPLQAIVPLKIAFVSRMDYYGKGLDILLSAIKILKEEGWAEKIRFMFYGKGEQNVLDIITELNPIAEYRGYVTGQSKREAFESSCINILPSRSEGMPITILESLSYGRPCIVTRMTNMAELMEEYGCGWVIDLTVESIVTTVKEAYNELMQHNKTYQDKCKKVVIGFSWNTIAKMSIDLYDLVIQERIKLR